MTPKRALIIALVAMAATPAAAAAQQPIPPPKADYYLNPAFFHSGIGLVKGDIYGFSADTTHYGTQTNMYDPAHFNLDGTPMGPPGPNGPPEPVFCDESSTTYGNTMWTAFKSKQYGVAHITASSGTFDEVIRVIQFKDPDTNPAPELPGSCFDDVAGFDQTASGIVFPGQWFAVQTGGTLNNAATGGPMQVKVSLSGPPKVDADALLFWRLKPLRVTSLVVQGVTKGAKVTLTCTKGACKTIRKNASKSTRVAFRPIARADKTKFALIKNRKVRKGATITVRVTSPGYIGKHFFWRVQKNALTNKKVSCMNPGSSKPHKPGTCHG